MSTEMTWSLYPTKEFTKHSEQWDSLNAKRGNSLLLCSTFVQPLINHFAKDSDRLAILGSTLNPRAMTIVSKTGFGRWISFQPSQAPIGCWVQQENLDIDEACSSLLKALPGLTLTFSITQQDPDIIPRPAKQKSLSTLDYIETARITVNSDFDEYWSQRSKNLRQGLKRQRNRLKRENIQTKLVEITDPSQTLEAITSYGVLESASWKSGTGTAVNIDNTQGQFYRELLEAFCTMGKGLVYQYLYNDTLVAADLCIHDNESIIILKTTYDMNINTSSPAMLMRQDAFKSIFDDRRHQKIEFYGKVMDWHKKWSSEIRCMYHINSAGLIASFLKSLRH